YDCTWPAFGKRRRGCSLRGGSVRAHRAWALDPWHENGRGLVECGGTRPRGYWVAATPTPRPSTGPASSSLHRRPLPTCLIRLPGGGGDTGLRGRGGGGRPSGGTRFATGAPLGGPPGGFSPAGASGPPPDNTPRHAGVGTETAYRHFPNKQAIAAVVLAEATD